LSRAACRWREDGETEVNVGAGSALVTMNVLTFEVPPAAASLTTVTAALAAAAICAAVTWAVNCVAESNVVSIAVPFTTLSPSAQSSCR
jgi:hypothetical protein